MPRSPVYHEPDSVEGAVALLRQHGTDAKVVGGATALTIMLRQRLITPAALVSLGRIDGLRTLREEAGRLVIGALVTHREVELSPLVRGRIPLLAETFATVANVRVRNAATVGGVVAEADYASDPPCALVALEAEIEAVGPGGPRRIAAGRFFRGFYETTLEPDEIVVAVHVPVPAARTQGVYEKFVTRSSEDRPCVGVAVLAQQEDGRCSSLRVVVGAAAETPRRYPEHEALALGRPLDGDTAAAVAAAYAGAIEPLDDMRGSAWYRKAVIEIWVRRAIERAAAGR